MSLHSFLNDGFIQMALVASLLASLASGTMGSFVVVKRIVFIAGSIAHSILAGTSLCLWFQRTQGIEWLGPIEGAFIAAIGSALILGWIHLRYKQREDSIIAAIWSTGMAIGIILLSITPGNTTEMLDFLFGNILWITPKDLYLLLGLDLIILGAISLCYRKFLALCFDEEQAILRGVPVQAMYMLLLTIIAITIVLLIQIIGTILVIALLTIPATLASLFTRSLPSMMLLASLLCAFFSTCGIGISYFCNWPSGATIALLAAICYLSALLFKRKRNLSLNPIANNANPRK